MKRRRKMIKNICWRGSGMMPGRRRWSQVRLVKPVADFLLVYSYAKDIWDMLVNVNEQSIIQRLSLLMMEFLKLWRDAEMDTAAYVAEVEKLFSVMKTELYRRESHDIPLNCCMGRAWQQWDLIARSLATSGVT